jgi:DNA-binding response OmpR family regulator
MIKILIVEDERPISDLIQMNLEAEGYHCTCAYDGETAANLLESESFDLALLDIMLPKINGYELLDYVNSIGIPAIFLTAKATIKDKVYGLRLGAEDYIIKPFDVSELLARVEVVLRRYHKKEELLSFHDIIIDCQKKTVLKNDTLLNLTPKEFDLLCFFVRV